MNQNYLNLVKLYQEQNKPVNNHLFNALDGYSKGNMFEDLYDQYQNYQIIKRSETNPYDVLRAHQFALIDLGLYLDLHPNDQVIKKEYDEHLKKYNETKKLYEAQIGPLTIDCEKNSEKGWLWQKNWPFNGGRN